MEKLCERSKAALDRPGVDTSGTDKEHVPVDGLTENFSLMPRIAPPPLGTDTEGSGAGPPEPAPGRWFWCSWPGALAGLM